MRSRHDQPSFKVESLESRKHLNGVTLIAHGRQQKNTIPTWEIAMAKSIAARIEEKTGVEPAIYTLKVEKKKGKFVTSLTLDKDSAEPSRSYDIIVKVDWTSSSRIDSSAPPVGKAIAERLLASGADDYELFSDYTYHSTDLRLVEFPLHFIGHSRGAYVLNNTAKRLGEAGVWVDQSTSLDPQGYSDGKFQNWSNIRFADNYFQQSTKLAKNTLAGFPIAGTVEQNLIRLNGFKDAKMTRRHALVHSFYQGTIDLNAEKIDGHSVDRNAWYGIEDGMEPITGFSLSHYGGGVRPANGLAKAGAKREAVKEIASGQERWDNVEVLSVNSSSTTPWLLLLEVEVEDVNGDAEIHYRLDNNQNPIDSRPEYLKTHVSSTQSENGSVTLHLDMRGIPAGSYFVNASVTNYARMRHAYAGKPVVILTPFSVNPPIRGGSSEF